MTEIDRDFAEFKDLIRDRAEDVIRTRAKTSLWKYWYVACYLSKERFILDFSDPAKRRQMLFELSESIKAEKRAEVTAKAELSQIDVRQIIPFSSALELN